MRRWLCRQPISPSLLPSGLLCKPYLGLDYHILSILSIPQHSFPCWEWVFKRWGLECSYLTHVAFLPWNPLAISLGSLCSILAKLWCGAKPYWVLSHATWQHFRPLSTPDCAKQTILLPPSTFSAFYGLLDNSLLPYIGYTNKPYFRIFGQYRD